MKKHHYPSRDPIRNYFPLPNEIFQLGLTPGELAVYSFLLQCENRETYQCYPSYRTIGQAVGLTRNTVKKYVDSLVDKGLIYTEPTSIFTKAGKKQNGSLLYTIRPISEAKQCHVDRQLLENKRREAAQRLTSSREV
jgi:predicted transcriptional regulator